MLAQTHARPATKRPARKSPAGAGPGLRPSGAQARSSMRARPYSPCTWWVWPKAWLRPFLIVFVSWLPWALATPFIIALGRRWPIVRGQILKAMSLHLAAFAAISVTAEGWSALLQVVFDPWHRKSPPTFVDTWSDLLLEQIVTFLIAYALIVAATYVMDSRQKMARQNEEL